MADTRTLESSVLQVVMEAFASPAVQQIGDVFDLSDHLKEVQNSLKAQAVLEDVGEINGALRIQLRNDVYEAEDFLHTVTAFAAGSGDSRNQQKSEGMVFAFGGVAS